MSLFEMTTDGAPGPGRPDRPPSYETSPFAAATLFAEAPTPQAPGALFAERVVTTPFAESLATFHESDLEAEAYDALRAEFEDDGFREALEVLTDEAAARHLTATGTWGQEAEAFELASSEAEQWMETVAAAADRVLGELEAHFGDRPADAGSAAEIDAVAGFSAAGVPFSPVDAQELFLGGLLNKVKKVVQGVTKVVKKGVGAVTKMLPLGKLFGFLKKLVRPLLQRVLQKAIGKLPAPLQPIARKLAGRFAGGGAAGSAAPGPAVAAPAAAGAPAADAPESESRWSAESLASDFDARLAEALLAPDDAVAGELLAEAEADARSTGRGGEAGPLATLDAGRQRLARQLVESQPGRSPVEEMEQFIPVVLAALPLIKVGISVIGRKKVVGFVADLLATLIKGVVGAPAAKQLSTHIADAGLGLLGLEAERAGDGRLGAEAVVAATEDTIREVFALPAASLGNELLVEAATQEAFTAAVVRHFPATVLKPDLVAAETEGERGIWLMFPRAAAPHYRYKKYSVVQPVQITRPLARAVTFADGETLEDRLLDAGARSWPMQGEVHFYELLPGAEFGHLAAFEADDEGTSYGTAAQQFEELSPSRPLPVGHPRPGPRDGTPGPERSRRPGTRAFRIKVRGVKLHRRPPLGLRLDLTSGAPVLRVQLRVGERTAHELVADLEHQRLVQVVATIRRLVGAPVRQALAARLHRVLAGHGVPLAEGGAARLAGALAEAIARAVAKELPAAAAALATAAKDPAPGVTLTFAFSFADRAALAGGTVADPTLTVTSGVSGG